MNNDSMVHSGVEQRRGQRAMIELNAGQLIKTCINTLEDRGYDIQQSSDFGSLEPAMLAIGKGLISPNFTSSQNDFSDANAHWLSLWDGDDLVAVLGARLDNAGEDGLAALVARSLTRLYAGGKGTAVTKQTAAFDQFKGEVIYFGDLFIPKHRRGSRPVLMCFVHLMHALSFQRWPSATCVYAFHRAEDVLKGRADQYGFGNRWPRAQVWTNPPDYRSDHEYLSTLTRKDFDIRAATFADAPELLFDWDEKPTLPAPNRDTQKSS